MVLCWIVYCCNLSINKYKKRLIVSSFVDGFTKDFKTMPDHLSNIKIGLFPNFSDLLISRNLIDLSKNGHKKVAKNFHLLLPRILLQTRNNPQIIIKLKWLFRNITTNRNGIHLQYPFGSKCNINGVHESFEGFFVELFAEVYYLDY